ncbi:MAG TPA: DUF4157 domain-containing protein, partial [Haliangium sp.]|nr:DUF4157 domain-containing protein [Haliangium sp.]
MLPGTASPGSEVPHREQMEAAFGEDFSDVRAHVGASSEMRAIGARGAARGETIAFAEANPTITDVAHELTHVVQHRRHGGEPERPSRRQDAAEREAEAVAHAVARGEPAPRIQSAATTDASPSEQAPGAATVASGDPEAGLVTAPAQVHDLVQEPTPEQEPKPEQEPTPTREPDAVDEHA